MKKRVGIDWLAGRYRLLGAGIFFLFVLFFSSCEVDDDYYYQNTGILCSRDWVTTYGDYDSETDMILLFREDGTGVKIHEVYYYPFSSRPDVIEYPFTWWWKYTDEIVMNYAGSGVIDFSRIHVSYNRLSGYLDG
ncbi:MAG: hypothetical protein LUD74_03045, partial [Tannerellaceae bacterium]|nr:hypothetical protein [Tannerellaceae bacterium]